MGDVVRMRFVLPPLLLMLLTAVDINVRADGVVPSHGGASSAEKNESDPVSSSRLARLGWKSEDFFENPDVFEVCRAIERNQSVQVEHLVRDGVNVNTVGKGGVNLLLWSYLAESPESFKTLLSLGADPSLRIGLSVDDPRVRISSGDSILSMDLECTDGHTPWIDLLIEFNGFAIKKMIDRYEWRPTSFFDDSQYIAMCEAIEHNSVVAVERLIAEGVDVNATGNDRMTFLMWAFAAESYEVFETLLSHGADPNLSMRVSAGRDGDRIWQGDSVALVAAGFDDRDLRWLRLVLLHHGDVDQAHEVIGSSLLARARSRRHTALEAVQLVLSFNPLGIDHQDAGGVTVAMNAALRCGGSGDWRDWELLRLLLEYGASANCYDFHGRQLIDNLASGWSLRRSVQVSDMSGSRRVLSRDYSVMPRDHVLALLSARGYDLKSARNGLSEINNDPNGSGFYRPRQLRRRH